MTDEPRKKCTCRNLAELSREAIRRLKFELGGDCLRLVGAFKCKTCEGFYFVSAGRTLPEMPEADLI